MNIWYFHPYGGGPGIGRFHRPYQLAKAWQAQGHSVTVFVASYHHLLDAEFQKQDSLSVDGVSYVFLKARSYRGNGVGRILNMYDYCRGMWSIQVNEKIKKPDVIIVSSPHPFVAMPARKLANKYSAKMVFEVRDLWPLSITAINGTSTWHPFVLACSWAEKYAYRKADLVASLLPGVEKYLIENKYSYQKFVWVPNGLDIDDGIAYSPVSVEGLRAAEILNKWRTENRYIVIHPGAMGPPNGLDNLLDAVAIFNRTYGEKNIGVLLVGQGSLKEHLMQRVEDEHMANVGFADQVSKNDATYLITQCDLGYAGGLEHSRVYKYGISFNKIMDFLRAGKPCLLPFAAYGNAIEQFNAGLVVANGTPADIAAGLWELLSGKKQISVPEQQQLEECYGYSNVAARYVAAL